ncbi:hypothetical protein PspLS_09775 [Pyricularia sp. CBS 133598]|nr:hypothetical protein PspLS_09775 [Pyricularia sp. CBS 133598]
MASSNPPEIPIVDRSKRPLSKPKPPPKSKPPLKTMIANFVKTWDETTDAEQHFFSKIWPVVRCDYEKLAQSVAQLITDTLANDTNPSKPTVVFPVEHRTKSENSIKQSIKRREINLGERGPVVIFDEIHDLVGLKIIVEGRKDLEPVSEFIVKQFTQSGNTVKFLRDRQNMPGNTRRQTEFGAYETWNYRVRLNPSTGHRTRFEGVLSEIQLTTWAEAMYNILDHPLNYKGASFLSWQERQLMDLCHGNLGQISVIMDGLRGPMQAVNLIANAGTGTSAARLLLERIRQYTKKQYAATDTTSAGPEQEFQDIVKTMRWVLKIPDEEAERNHMLTDALFGRAILVEVGIDKSLEKHERFLDSLDFPGREERQNNIREAYTETFEWIFADSRFEDYNDSLSDYSLSDDSLDDNAPLHNEINETAADERSRNEAIDISDRTSSRTALDRAGDNFVNWLGSDENMYWISGKPGSGKSSLVKFILTAHETKKILSQRQQSTRILSHFFWRAGSNEQNSLKGFLCNIIHQLAIDNEGVLGSLLAQVPGWQRKRYYTSWSLEELQDLVDCVFASEPSQILLLIDGLDEVSVTEGELLRQKVDRLKDLENVKICVSSRPELPYLQALQHHPNLRLQDLTAGDMQRYITANLLKDLHAKFEHPYSLARDHGINPVICLGRNLLKKAEGVFLWLRLVIESLRRGMANADSIEDIQRRLDELPGGMLELYQTMWFRVNEDTKEYHQDGARYINIVLNYGKMRDLFLAPWSGGVPLSLLEATKSSSFRYKLFKQGRSAMDLALPRISQRVQTRCAGLVEFTLCNPQYFPIHHDKGCSRQSAKIVHRSAYDFLETEEGQKIRNHDTISESELRLDMSQAVLAFLQEVMAMPTPAILVEFRMELPMEPLKGFRGDKDKLYEVLDLIGSHYALSVAEPWNQRPHFLALLLDFGRWLKIPYLSEFVISRIVSKASSRLASRLLREALTIGYQCWPHNETFHGDCVRVMSQIGAQMHERGAFFTPFWVTTKESIPSGVPWRYNELVVPFLSPTALFFLYHLRSPSADLQGNLDKASSFLTKSLVRNERTPLLLIFIKERTGGRVKFYLKKPLSSKHGMEFGVLVVLGIALECLLLSFPEVAPASTLQRSTADHGQSSGQSPERGRGTSVLFLSYSTHGIKDKEAKRMLVFKESFARADCSDLNYSAGGQWRLLFSKDKMNEGWTRCATSPGVFAGNPPDS